VGEFRLDGGLGGQLVGARRQLQGQAAGRLAVVAGRDGKGLGGQLHLGHVAQADLGAVLVHLEEDLLELLGRLHAARPDDGGVQALAGNGRQSAQLAG